MIVFVRETAAVQGDRLVDGPGASSSISQTPKTVTGFSARDVCGGRVSRKLLRQ